MSTLSSPGVSVTVTDESQYSSNTTRDTVPLVVIATHQDKTNPSGTGIAPFSTLAEANKPKLISSSRELVQNFGNPVFYDVNGTVQQGYELNEYGLLAAYKALNVTNRVWVIRGDVNLAELVPSVEAPSGLPMNGSYWFDTNDTEYGIFKYSNGEWTYVSPTIINDDANLTGATPAPEFGKDGDVSVVTVDTVGLNQVWEKINGSWQLIGSAAWDSVTKSSAVGSVGFTSQTSTILSNLPTGGQTVSISVGGGAATTTTLKPIVAGSATLTDTNLLGLRDIVINGTRVVFGSAIAGTVTGSVTHSTANTATASSVGDRLKISDWNGTAIVSDTVAMRIRLVGESAFPAANPSETFQINGQTIATGAGLSDVFAASTAINNIVSVSGSSPQGVKASGALIEMDSETEYDGAGNNGSFNGGTGYSVGDDIVLSDGSIVNVVSETSGEVTGFEITKSGDTGLTSFGALSQATTDGSGTGFTLTPASNNVALQLIKDTSVAGEALTNKIQVDLTGLTTALETTPATYPAAGAATTTFLSVNEIVKSINSQLKNTDNITATVGASNVVTIADSVTAIKLENVNGSPLNDLGLRTSSSVPIATVVSQLSGITDVTASGSSGTNITITFDGTGVLNITEGTALSVIGISTGKHGVSLAQAVSQINNSTSSDPLADIEVDGSLNFITLTDMTANETMAISGSGAIALGLPSVVNKNKLFYGANFNVPENPSNGDFWIKTTAAAQGANYVIRQYSNLSGQYELQKAPLYKDNATAFDQTSPLVNGSMYIQFDPSEDGSASHVFKRYNGSTILNLEISSSDFNAGVSIKVGNGRSATQSVDASSMSSLVAEINNLNQDNLEAEMTTSGFIIKNTAGEDIVLEDDASTVSSVLGSNLAEGRYSNWVQLRNYKFGQTTGYTASPATPFNDPDEGTKWYNGSIATDDFDLLVHNGTTWITNPYDLQLSFVKPSTKSDGSSALSNGDIWVDTSDIENFPVISKWNGTQSKWVKIDNTDQSSTNGILFADARVDNTSNLDPDCPNPNVYPTGMLLWNTRASSLVVKEYRSEWFGDNPSFETYSDVDYNSVSYDVGEITYPPVDSKARWVTVSGNREDGSPYMGRHAQRAVIVKSLAAALETEELRDPRGKFFNIMLAPSYPELLDNMISLNVDRRETAFIIGDSPMRLNPSTTALQDWATNANGAFDNGDEGLVSRNEYSAIYYPSVGLTTNIDGANVAMPSSIAGLSAFLYNDNVSYPWYAPAGLNRGIIGNVFSSVGYITDESEYSTVTLSRGQQDTLYVNNINPIVNTAGRGLYVNGQKTLSPRTSALDRINVARLVVYLRYQLEIMGEEFLFELNNQFTRDQVKTTFDLFFNNLVSLNGVYDYLVVCDETNNTPQRIDANELWIDIAIAPSKAIDFIYIPLRLKNTGEDLAS